MKVERSIRSSELINNRRQFFDAPCNKHFGIDGDQSFDILESALKNLGVNLAPVVDNRKCSRAILRIMNHPSKGWFALGL